MWAHKYVAHNPNTYSKMPQDSAWFWCAKPSSMGTCECPLVQHVVYPLCNMTGTSMVGRPRLWWILVRLHVLHYWMSFLFVTFGPSHTIVVEERIGATSPYTCPLRFYHVASPFYQSSGSNCPLVFVPSEFRKVYMGAVVGEGLFSETELVLMSLSTQAKKKGMPQSSWTTLCWISMFLN